MQVASMDKKRFTLPNWAAYLINAALFAAFIIGGNAVFSSGALPGFITKVAMLIGIQVIAAVSLNISTGYLGQLPLGHAGFMAVGAYASAIFMTRTGIPAQLAFPLGIVIGAAVAGLFGVLIGIPALRLKGDYLAIITLGFGEIIRVVLLNIDSVLGFKLTNGAAGLQGIPKTTTFVNAWLMVGLTCFLIHTFMKSRHGRAVLSIREYSKWIQSYRDLPVLYNQWCNVMRWEKSTRPFLRTSEFLWQEGHTAHETHEDAQEETIRMLNVYYDFMVNVLAIPVVRGRKSESERFAGAEATYTLEALMHDGKALQMGTSHNLSDHFARSYDIKYLSREGKQEYCYTTSWGTSTRMIGGMIMVHGDDRGLKLPPKVAPIQVVILPIAMHKEGVLEKATELYNEIKASGLRVKLDDSEQSAGWKFNQWEMKGVPARIEIGPRDIENGVVTVGRRDTLEKFTMPIKGIGENLVKLMADIHQTMYDMAFEHRKAHTTHAENFGDFMDGVKKGFVKAPWCADPDCEMEIKCVTGASTRCKPMDEDTTVKPGCKCVFCNREAKTMMYFARAY